MADRDFRIDLLMRAHFDQAKKALDDADRKLGGIGKTLDGVNRKGLSFGSAMNGIAIGVTAAATAATAVMGLYISKTIEAEKVQAQLQSRLKDTGGVAGRTLQQLNEQASKLQNVTVFDDEAIGNAQAMLLTFTQIRGVNFDRTIEAATNLATVMGTDVTDAAKLLGKALSEPEQGLGALRKAGVTFTDAQTEQIKKMIEAGQIAEAQTVILDKLQGTMGTAAAAARDTLGGALQELKGQFDNLLEGKSGDAGIVGTRQAVEDLIKTLQDPNTKAGFDAFIGDLVQVIGFAVKTASAVGGITQQIKDAISADSQKSYLGLLAKRAALEDDLGDLQSHNPLRRARMGLGGRSGQALTGEAGIQAAIAQVDQLLAKQRSAMQAAERVGQFDNVVGGAHGSYDNPAPAGEGVPKPHTGGSKADPDADIKRRIASLAEETALLGQVKDGEDKASEAAKARYAVTEGEFKNKSPQLKAQLVAAAEALDQKNADIEAEKKRQEAIEASKKAYDDLLQGLRTPAEVAVDDAIAKLDALNKAMQDGIGTKAEYDQAQQRIAQGLIGEQPGFQGLAPEVGGAFGELGKLDQAASAEQQWYQDSLQRLQDYRAQKGASQAAADAEEERVEAEHQQRMHDIEAARQQANLDIASNFFGQLATLQRSHNSKMAAVGKAAAIAQTIIETYKSATSAYAAMASIPYVGPALGAAAAAAAIAAGLANVAQIRSQSTTGYADGGYTGDGGKYQPAGIVHAGEFVIRKEVTQQAGMRSFLQAINDGEMRAKIHGWAGYADGGFVGDSRMAPAIDFAALERSRAAALAGQGGGNRLSLYNLFDMDALAQKLANHPAMEKRIVTVASENGAAIRSEW